MIVVMQPGCLQEHMDHVVALIREAGLTEHVSVGTDRTIIGAIGDKRHVDMSALENAPMVDRLVPILAPYKLASREVRAEPSVVPLGNRAAVGGPKVCVIAGPCSVESEQQLMSTARAVAKAGAVGLRGGAFKPRTNPYDFQGLGEEALKLLASPKAAGLVKTGRVLILVDAAGGGLEGFLPPAEPGGPTVLAVGGR